MSDNLTERVMSVIAASKRIPHESVTVDSSLEQLGLDSLDQLNLLFALETEFNISIPDEQAKSIHTVREMVEGVRKLIAGAAGQAAPQPAA